MLKSIWLLLANQNAMVALRKFLDKEMSRIKAILLCSIYTTPENIETQQHLLFWKYVRRKLRQKELHYYRDVFVFKKLNF